MGAAKDMWMDEIQDVGEMFRKEVITREEAVKRLCRLGFDLGEANDMLTEVVS